jgi:hypothetical protein
MRSTGRIESLSYSTIYILGAAVAALMTYSQGVPWQRLLMHALCSWGYVIYAVINAR